MNISDLSNAERVGDRATYKFRGFDNTKGKTMTARTMYRNSVVTALKNVPELSYENIVELETTGHCSMKRNLPVDEIEQWLGERLYEHQRKLRPTKVQFLAKQIETQRFKPYTSIDFAIHNGRAILTDGQHRLNAVVQQKRWGMPFVINYYKCETEKDIANLYNRTDIGTARTISDRLRATGLAERLGLSQSNVNYFGAGIRFMYTNFTGKTPKAAQEFVIEDYEMAMEYFSSAFGMYLLDLEGASSDNMKLMMRRSTVSVALATYEFSSQKFGLGKISDFWRYTALDDGLRLGDPRKVAIRHLMTYAISGGASNRGKTTSAAMSARTIAHCFNAWVRDREITMTRVLDASAAISLAGFDEKMLPPISSNTQ